MDRRQRSQGTSLLIKALKVRYTTYHVLGYSYVTFVVFSIMHSSCTIYIVLMYLPTPSITTSGTSVHGE